VSNLCYLNVWQVAGFSPSVDDVKLLYEDDGLITTVNVRGDPHGVRKPTGLLRELTRMYSKYGDVVVEVACGSAPASRASLLEGRICLSVDRDRSIIPSVKAHLSELRENLISSLHTKQISKKRKGTASKEEEETEKDDKNVQAKLDMENRDDDLARQAKKSGNLELIM
jgi:hypothetical protein